MICNHCNSNNVWLGVQIAENKNRIYWIICTDCKKKSLHHLEKHNPAPITEDVPQWIKNRIQWKSENGHLIKIR